MQKKTSKPRNRHAMNPLMRKGGVHKKSKSAERSQYKTNLKKELKVTDFSSFFGLSKSIKSRILLSLNIASPV